MSNWKAREKAYGLISQAKEWLRLCKRREAGVQTQIGITESGAPIMRDEEPGRVSIQMRETLQDMDPDLRESVMEEVDKIYNAANNWNERLEEENKEISGIQAACCVVEAIDEILIEDDDLPEM